jgi:uncharacterized repeat protein (TIGR03803 family)
MVESVGNPITAALSTKDEAMTEVIIQRAKARSAVAALFVSFFYASIADADSVADISQSAPPATLTVLYSFGGAGDRGADVVAPLAHEAAGNFYGTTLAGGAYGKGTIFEITPTGILTYLHSFGGEPGDADGESPIGLVPSEGYYFGITQGGGENGHGTIYRITPNGALTTLYSFAGKDGSGPTNLMKATDGNFYGTTPYGGANGYGTVFKITIAGSLTTIHSFKNTDGSGPTAALLEGSDGYLYGTTQTGGASGFGTVFKITTSGALTSLHSFRGNDGAYPAQNLVQDGSAYYGTTASGGNGFGTVVIAGVSVLYPGEGTAFKISSEGVLTTLYKFTGPQGGGPVAALVKGSNANFYGSTFLGGAKSEGTLFELTPSGTLTTLYSFSGKDGQRPSAAMLQGSDGNFYGTTASGGALSSSILSSGTIFKLSVGGLPAE